MGGARDFIPIGKNEVPGSSDNYLQLSWDELLEPEPESRFQREFPHYKVTKILEVVVHELRWELRKVQHGAHSFLKCKDLVLEEVVFLTVIP